MNFLAYLQESAFTDWLLVSMLGFPTLIALHSVGMAVVVGLTLIVALRLNGWLSGIDGPLVLRFLRIAAWGFTLNLVTGLAIFVTRGSEYITAGIFLIKMGLVFASALILFWLGWRLRSKVPAPEIVSDNLAGSMSAIAAALWFGAVVTGRLIAYLSDLY